VDPDSASDAGPLSLRFEDALAAARTLDLLVTSLDRIQGMHNGNARLIADETSDWLTSAVFERLMQARRVLCDAVEEGVGDADAMELLFEEPDPDRWRPV
jgi:hypothetical protein